MLNLPPRFDCPDCESPGSVEAGVCDVCLADVDERVGPVEAAGARAERLLGSLRSQFLRDLRAPRLGSAGAE